MSDETKEIKYYPHHDIKYENTQCIKDPNGGPFGFP